MAPGAVYNRTRSVSGLHCAQRMRELPGAVISAVAACCDFHEFLGLSVSCRSAWVANPARRFAYECWASQIRCELEREVLGTHDIREKWLPEFWYEWRSGNDFLED